MNVIYGTYVDQEVDLVIPAVQPLTIERSYVSTNDREAFVGNGWHINHEAKITPWLHEDDFRLYYSGPFGENLIFERKFGRRHPPFFIKLADRVLKKGVTNCASGTLDARVNIKNTKCEYQEDKKIEMTTAAGSKYYLERSKRKEEGYFLNEIKFLSGPTLRYEYEDKCDCPRAPKKTLSQIRAFSANGALSAFIHLRDLPNYKKSVVFEANDGRQVIYHYRRFENKLLKNDRSLVDKNKYFLWKVMRPNAPEETFEYEESSLSSRHCERIIRKERPDGRYLAIDYYRLGVNRFGYSEEKIDLNHYSLNRVSTLKGPVGCTENPIRMYSFHYSPQVCRVEDAYRYVTHYKWDENDRLKEIDLHRADGSIYVQEKFQWGREGTFDHTQLVSHLFGDGSAKESFCRYFNYNERGCLNENYLFGNLSGQNNNAIILQPNGRPYSNGVEQYSISNHYNDLNLLVSENDGIHHNTYEYHAGTDLISACFTHSEGQIKIRRFYNYDAHGQLISEIVDNGNTRAKNNLSGVTERKIRYLDYNGTAWGLPAFIEEKYYDFSTKQEKLINRIVYNYTREGWIIQEDHFDNLEQFVFSIHRQYDTHGNVILEQNAEGVPIHRKYDINNNLIYEENPSFKTQYKYDLANRLIQKEEIHPDAHLIERFAYDLKGNQIRSCDIFCHETHYVYDEFDRLISTQMPDQITWTNAYDVMGNVIAQTNPNQETIYKSYTVRGQPVEITYPDGSSELNLYNRNGTLAKHINRDGSFMSYVYDFQDRPIRVDYYGSSGTFLYATTSTYDAFHLLQESDPMGVLTTYGYNCAGQLTHLYKGCQATIFEYDSRGRIIKTRKLGKPEETLIEAVSYDSMDRVIEERQELLNGTVLRKVGYIYDNLGRRTQIIHYIEDRIASTKVKYDSHDQVIEEEDPEGNITYTRYHYNFHNEDGQHVFYREVIDPKGIMTISIYNIQGKIAQTIKKDPFFKVIQQQEMLYGKNDLLLSLKETIHSGNDATKERVTQLTYNSMGQTTSICEAEGSPDEVSTHYIYETGRKTAVIKPDGQRIHYGYDEFGRLIWQKGNSLYDTFQYDLNGNLLEVTDHIKNVTTERHYNALNNLIHEKLSTGYECWYEYDSLGRLIYFKLFDQSSVDYFHGKDQGLTRKDSNGNSLYTYSNSSDFSGNVLEETLIGSAGKIQHHYSDKSQRLTSIHPRWDQKLQYDPLGNMTEASLNDSLGESANQYSYDSLNQILSETGNAEHKYTYDSAYNRLSVDDSTFTYNSLNQIMQAADQYRYDANGNLISKNDITYSYDILNRLVQVTEGSNITHYSYDFFNRRVAKEVLTETSDGLRTQEVIHFLYQGQQEIGSVKNGEIQEIRFLHLNGKGAEIGATVAIELQGITYAPIHDSNGNIAALLLAETGECIESYRYSAFGESTISKLGNPWGFASKRYDVETGFTFFGRRYYDPHTGRWTTKDPLGLVAGINYYAYVFNNPLTHFDLYGLIAQAKSGIRPASFRRGGERAWEGIKNGVKSIVGGVAKSLDFVAKNVLYLPPFQDVVRYPLHYLNNWATDGTDPYEPTRLSFRCRTCIVGHREIKGLTPIMINGIDTSYERAKAWAQEISDANDGLKIYVFYRADKGGLANILDVCVEYANGSTSANDYFIGCMNYLLDQKGPNQKIGIFAHSAGSTLVYAAQGYLRGREKQIYVRTYGSPVPVPQKTYAHVKNNMSTRDPICFTCPVKYARAALTGPEHVNWLESKEIPFTDHPWGGDTYKTQFQQDLKKFIE